MLTHHARPLLLISVVEICLNRYGWYKKAVVGEVMTKGHHKELDPIILILEPLINSVAAAMGANVGHSAEYQTEQYIKRLEQAVQNLTEEGTKLKENGQDAFALSVFDQVDQLKRAIAELRHLVGSASSDPKVS
ncbi:hypothetical protein [Pseudomonas veronii]|uniref:hypothetical protein n=1 Tax=Pseudomonas veronii TaxID=76761 RepID=UPI000F84CF62|nr:hypothetical protein [Pseudomonas veronii]RTY78496.1 hypothetical protein EKA83_08830 [Pseudomonas veronii]